MEWLQYFFENSQYPALSAFVLGLMTAISPCPLATNITAVGFISKDIAQKKRVFVNGLIYTLGRAVTYFGLGLAFYFGLEQFELTNAIQEWGEKLIGPLLVIIGLFMLGVFNFSIPLIDKLTGGMERRKGWGFWNVLLMGIVFALAFCPYSGVLYFGILIPMTVGASNGFLLPLVFAIATGIPVVLFSWLIAFGIGSLAKVYNRIKVFELWFRRVVAVIFVLAGFYQIFQYFISS